MALGEWTLLDEQADALAMHAGLLPTGQVLYFGGDERRVDQHNLGPAGWNHTRLWTPGTGKVVALPSPDCDLFCCGHCFLASGHLLTVGGTEAFFDEAGPIHGHLHLPGVRNAAKFDVAAIDQIWHNEQSAPGQPTTPWTGWYPLDHTFDRAKFLTVAQYTDGRLHAFMIGADGRLRHNEQIAYADPAQGNFTPINPGQTWTGWRPLVADDNRGKALIVEHDLDGRLHAFMIGTDDQIWHCGQTTVPSQLGTMWTNWFVLSTTGDRARSLSVLKHADGHLHAFRIGMDDQLWHNEQNKTNSSWTSWKVLGSAGNRGKELSVIEHSDGRLHAFMIGMDDQIWHLEQPQIPATLGQGWPGQWNLLSAAGDRAKHLLIVKHDDGRLHAFRIGMNGQVDHNEQDHPSPGNASSWTGWRTTHFSSIGERAKVLKVVKHADGRLHAFMVGLDDQLWHKEQVPFGPITAQTDWSATWQPLDNYHAKDVAVVPLATGRIHVFVIERDNQIYRNEQVAPVSPGSAWAGWRLLSEQGDRAQTLVVVPNDLAASRLHAFAVKVGRSPWIDLPFMLPERTTNKGGGRWYPTAVTLPDGRVAVMGGHPGSQDPNHSNFMVEVFDPSTNQWSDAGDEPASVINRVTGVPEIYPRLHVLPDGNVFCVLLADDVSYKWNPTLKTFTPQTAAGASIPEMRFQNNSGKNRWTSVLLPLRPQTGFHPFVLAAGGMSPTYVFDVLAPQNGWQAHARAGAAPPRKYASLVLTPDGKVLMLGGTRGGADGADDNDAVQAVLQVEQFDPATGAWTTLAAATVPRQYHSTALLLPDGRVWTGGSNVNDTMVREERMEVYSPPYLFAGPRPVISSVPDVIQWNTNFEIGSPDAAGIVQVVLIRCGSATHGFDSDQRLVELHIQGPSNNNRIVVKAPPHGMVAPPGYYMLFILNGSAVPSHAVIVRCAG